MLRATRPSAKPSHASTTGYVAGMKTSPEWSSWFLALGFLIAFSSLLSLSSAQSSGCTSALVSLSPCLSYLEGNSSAHSPTCCAQLDAVASSQPACLCSAVNGSLASPGLTFNQTQASTLLAACGVKISPELNACITAMNNPGASPATAPPPGAPSPGSGGATSPTTGNASKATVAASPKLPLLYLAAGGSIIFSFSNF